MERASHCCEYCKSQDRFSPVYFSVDHIIPVSMGGSQDIDNMAYACMLCNRLKWNKISVLDPVSQLIVNLFDPRRDSWASHFQWSEDYLHIIGVTPVGRATVNTLQLNREKLVHYRSEMAEIGYHPPISA
ncbi:MAG TPA: HNH endonuclease signature motif containing protein [Saprospiraceae bacterium]|nr:HNH endonuclease signature motif containing protein [Saprospiraceae bacterium]